MLTFINRKLKNAVAEARSLVEGISTAKVNGIIMALSNFGCSVKTTFQFDPYTFHWL